MIMIIRNSPDDKTEVRFVISTLDLVMMSIFRSTGALPAPGETEETAT